jgi:hypothetical protein
VPPSIRSGTGADNSGITRPYSGRGTPQRYLDLTGAARHFPQQRVRHIAAEFVAAFTPAQCQRVGQHGPTARGPEDALHDHGLIGVAALAGEVTGRADRPVPGTVVQQAGEYRAAVEPRQAQPVHRAIPAASAAPLQSDSTA